MNISLRNVHEDEFFVLHELASQCKPLDLHTSYTYWVITHYYKEFCFILEEEENPVGFITALVNNSTGFIWQIGILQKYRGQKLSVKLIDSVLCSFQKKGIHLVQLTISPNNEASYNAFSRYCKNNAYSFQRLTNELIPDVDIVHTEVVYQITTT